jgi:hypothetical protein
MPEELDYVAKRPCGCFVMWMAATAPKKEIAKEVASMIRKGFDVVREPTEAVSNAKFKCEVCKPTK